ncbi:MAG: acetyl-CoA carboxylase carboxyltransferase subunit beta [Planctomycetes bacterium]|nr:acetyl-CoA carboxylase carboxyltransferase subunit beta [Planctomycetota bacterium]
MAWTRFGKKKDMPGGLWIKCESCGAMLFRKEFEQRHRVCGTCGYHFTLPARERIALTIDPGTFEEKWADLRAHDVLGFTDMGSRGAVPYGEKLQQTKQKTGESDAIVTGTGKVKGIAAAIGVMNFQFLGGSMGMVVGEKIALLCEHGLHNRLPVVLFACSGGARMHEGAVSLMQMAKTCGALQRLNAAGVPTISVMTHPTTGGVTASFASVCDLLLAEPGALIGFAGPRVIATTIKKELPKGFQRSEFLLEKGQIDRIVPRSALRDELGRVLAYATGGDAVAAFKPQPAAAEPVAVAASDVADDGKAKKKGKAKKA